MAVPKSKQSKQRTNTRYANFKAIFIRRFCFFMRYGFIPEYTAVLGAE